MQELLDLLDTMSFVEVLTCIVVVALAAKSVYTFGEWVYGKLKSGFKKQSDSQLRAEAIEKRLKLGDASFEALRKSIDEMSKAINEVGNQMAMLIDSDKDQIKSYITERHHFFCYEQCWIDDYSLECLERQFKHYQDEGGNSFIEEFMKEIRALPHQPTT